MTMVGLLQDFGKKPVVLRKEATGFVGNRLQFALFREALAIVEQGIADPEAVDQVVRFGFGRRLAAAGPFEVFDLAGLDTILAVATQIFPELDAANPTGQPVPELLSRKVAEGDLGVKSGRGFHEWTAQKADELRNRLTRALVQSELNELGTPIASRRYNGGILRRIKAIRTRDRNLDEDRDHVGSRRRHDS